MNTYQVEMTNMGGVKVTTTFRFDSIKELVDFGTEMTDGKVIFHSIVEVPGVSK